MTKKGLLAHPGIGRRGFENLRDSGVIEPPQDLGLEFEALQRLVGDCAAADQLDRNISTWLVLVRAQYDPHAAFSDHVFDDIVADAPAGPTHRGAGEKPADVARRGHEVVDLSAQFGVTGTCLVEVGAALRIGQRHRPFEYLADA